MRSVAAAIDGGESADVDGFRDYRGVLVVGAWRWLPEYGFGMATQVDAAEAFHLHRVARAVFGSLFGLLVMVSLGGLAVSHLVMRLRHQVDRAEHLGAYTLERKLGEGGMGEVHLARHALLRRPTAIKLLRSDKASEAAIARFEREVQLTSQLTHPNTIGIYDYGRTPDGTFYYAMEYIEGFTLAALVSRFGPLQEARVIHILRQVCGSLAEAHEHGLVHRDIKPANVMLAIRGGLYDHVKVLDFGLVREHTPHAPTPPTGESGAVAGTPLYMPPEAFQCPDDVSPRGDLYALGALAYYLLTGVPPFQAPNPFALYELHRREVPKPPSEVLGRKIDGVLEALVLACLEKSAAQRPADAGRLASLLEASPLHGAWTQVHAREWWERHGSLLVPSSGSASAEATSSPSATHGPEGTVMLVRQAEPASRAGASR
ncbi:MAG: serine/threonine protein kinase [Deltaproteobacteria bacterium]|nr:serine/threonine protein kinase [Deltaproteobacteria bacterium]